MGKGIKKISNYIYNISKPVHQQLVSVFTVFCIYGLVLLLDGDACLIKRFIGIPCPGCGMTRSYIALLHFDIKTALFFHPLFIVPLFIAFLLLFKQNRNVARWYKNDGVWLAMLVLTILTWAVRMILFFPDHAPMDLYRDAFLFRLQNFLGV